MDRSRAWLWPLAALAMAAVLYLFLNKRRAAQNETTTPLTPSASAPSSRPSGPLKTLGIDGGFVPPHSTLRDKPTRDDLRERIYRAFGESLPEFSGTAKPAAAEGKVLDKQYVGKRLHEDFIPLARECYEAALVRQPKLRGDIIFDFVIVGDSSVGGIVESAEPAPESTIQDPELVTCMRESLLSTSFEPPPNGGKVTVRFPISLSPDDEPDE